MSEGAHAKSLTTDRVFDLLGDGGRRRALLALWAADGEATLDDVAAATVARAEGVHKGDVTKDERERAAAALHHNHLPRLADADVVEYDPAEGRVVLTEVAAELKPYFRLVGTDE